MARRVRRSVSCSSMRFRRGKRGAHRGHYLQCGRMKWAIRASTALYGFALAISIAPRLQMRARPARVAFGAQLTGYSPNGLLLQFALAGGGSHGGVRDRGERITRSSSVSRAA